MNEPLASASISKWHAGPMPSDVTMALERLANTDDVLHIAVMPDVHLSNEICQGTVIATTRRLYPHAVGNDIGCGMLALRFQCDASLLVDEGQAARLLAGLYRTVPTIRHGQPTLRAELPVDLNDMQLSHARLEKMKGRDGRVEFATLGRGNHFIEFQKDEEDFLWLMIHSGSRGIGSAVNAHHINQARESNSGLPFLDADSQEGLAYLRDLSWAMRYAESSRRAMAEAVANLMNELFAVSTNWDTVVHCNHNHVRKESHFGEELWVHRKGAISAKEGEPGIIPGSMGTASFHVEGRGDEDSLCSSSHGAGRTMSRAQAFQEIPLGELHRQMKHVWFDRRLAGKLRDEAPSAYKDINAVMRAQRDLTRIVRKLRPILSYKGV